MKEIKLTLLAIAVCVVVGIMLSVGLCYTTEHQLEIFASLSFAVVLTLLLILKLVADVVSYEGEGEYLENKFKKK